MLPQFDDEAPEPIPSPHNPANRPPAVGTKRQLKPNTSPPHLTVKAETTQLVVTHMTFGRTWTIEKDIPDRSRDHEDGPDR